MQLEEILALTLQRPKNNEIKNIIDKKISFDIKKENIQKAREVIEKCRKKGIGIISFIDSSYPEELKNIYYPPLVMYYRGNPEILKKRKIGIIGTRKPTKYGREVAYEFSKEISKHGIVIISGGARGIDTLAHKGAIDSKGETICVLGSGVDVIYPPENKRIFKEIEKKGIILSEYPPGTKPFSYHFPMRNRIIAGLSELILVVEAGEKSGTFITVKWALDMGKDIFVIPGEIYSPKSKGPNFLLKQGAIPATEPSDILSFMGIEEKVKQKQFKLNEKEKRIFDYLKEKGRVSIDEMKENLKIETGEILSILLNLEIKGIIRNEGQGFYSLK